MPCTRALLLVVALLSACAALTAAQGALACGPAARSYCASGPLTRGDCAGPVASAVLDFTRHDWSTPSQEQGGTPLRRAAALRRRRAAALRRRRADRRQRYHQPAPTRPAPTQAPAPQSQLTPQPQQGGSGCGDAWISGALQAHNELRSGLAPLSCDAGAGGIAAQHSQDMCTYASAHLALRGPSHVCTHASLAIRLTSSASRSAGLSHDGFSERCQQAGFGKCAENVAYNFETRAAAGATVTAQWEDSPGHHANIVGGYSRVGVGYAKCADGKVMWTALFG